VVDEAPDLGEVARHDGDFAPETLLDGLGDPVRQTRLELSGCGGERLDLRPRAFEGSLEPARVTPLTGLFDVPFCAFERVFVHGRQGYSGRRMRSSELDYELPRELIAQHPAAQRDSSRLLVFDRASGDVRHRVFSDLPEELGAALVVVNDTRVI